MINLRTLYHRSYALLCAVFYGFPSGGLVVIGVTGTDGKSSSVILLASVLREAGFKTAHYSSISVNDGEVEEKNTWKMTMPGRGLLQKFMYNAKRRGVTHVVLEMTSQGIAHGRHVGIDLDLVLYTNITPEHIEAHGGFENYANAKFTLARKHFWQKKHLTIVARANEILLDEFSRNKNVVWFTASDKVPMSSLGGPFAQRNIAGVAAVARALEVNEDAIARGVEGITLIPGRYEIVSESPRVIIDYGHTLAALESLLYFAKGETKGWLIHVFGAAGGGRDRYKRPLLAENSARFADIIILTEENPFDEDPKQIVEDIISGFRGFNRYEVVPRREDAVRRALALAKPEDTVIFTAKGHESVIAIADGKYRPYEERVFVRTCSQ